MGCGCNGGGGSSSSFFQKSAKTTYHVVHVGKKRVRLPVSMAKRSRDGKHYVLSSTGEKKRYRITHGSK